MRNPNDPIRSAEGILVGSALGAAFWVALFFLLLLISGCGGGGGGSNAAPEASSIITMGTRNGRTIMISNNIYETGIYTVSGHITDPAAIHAQLWTWLEDGIRSCETQKGKVSTVQTFVVHNDWTFHCPNSNSPSKWCAGEYGGFVGVALYSRSNSWPSHSAPHTRKKATDLPFIPSGAVSDLYSGVIPTALPALCHELGHSWGEKD